MGASAAVTNLHSSVETDVRTNSTLTAARSYLQDANYLGRISNLGITGAGTLAGAGAVSVAINNINNRVASHFRSTTGATLTLHTDSAQITAERTTGIKLYGASAAVAVQGVAGAAFVGVNTVDGESEVTVQNADIRKTDAQGQSQGAQRIGIDAENKDTIDIVEIGVGAGAYGGAGASVVVNRIHDAARVNVNKSALAADTMEINAGQNRTVDGTLVMVTGGLIGGIAANVVATEIGEPTGNESIFGDAFPSGSADDPSDEVSGYQDKFGSVTTEELERVSAAYQAASIQVELLECDLHGLYAYMEESPQLMYVIIQLLSRTCNHLTEQLRRITLYDRYQKIASFLLHETAYPDRDRGVTDDEIPYTHEELALSLGMNRVTVSKVLSQWKQEGILSAGYGRIQIKNRRYLEDLLKKRP